MPLVRQSMVAIQFNNHSSSYLITLFLFQEIKQMEQVFIYTSCFEIPLDQHWHMVSWAKVDINSEQTHAAVEVCYYYIIPLSTYSTWGKNL